MASLLVFGLFFFLLFIILFRDSEDRFFATFLGLLIFPHVVAFRNSPYISPHTLLLYVTLAVEYFQHPNHFSEVLRKCPLKYPLIIFSLASLCTAVFTDGGLFKNVYDMFRYAADIYGFFLLGHLLGRDIDMNSLLKRLTVPMILFCTLGLIEAALGANHPYKIICSAFPIYQGNVGLGSAASLSQDWRTRIFITTFHPNTLCPILLSIFFLYFPKIFQKDKDKTLVVIAMVAVTVYLCGSRTGLVVTVGLLFLYWLRTRGIAVKILAVILAVTICSYGVKSFMEYINESGGSSLDLRQQQLLFSFVKFAQKPVTGNGVYYMTSSILETDAYGNRTYQSGIGSLESFLFKQLIEFGLVGLIAQTILIGFLIFYFLKRSKKYPSATQGLFITLALYGFIFLAGDSAGSLRLGFLLIGGCMGATQRAEEIELEEKEEEEKNQASLESESNKESKRSDAPASL